MNNLSRVSFLLAIASIVTAYFASDWREAASISATISTILVFITREVGHRRNIQLRKKVSTLDGSVITLDAKVDSNTPSRHTAAAIFGQGQLATWSYNDLIEQLKKDNYIY